MEALVICHLSNFPPVYLCQAAVSAFIALSVCSRHTSKIQRNQGTGQQRSTEKVA